MNRVLQPLRSWLHGKDANIERNGYLWNSVQGMTNAAQSVLIMIIVMRVCGPVEGGIFTLAFSVANMMLYIGKYGARSFQVTDYKEKYLFGEYIVHRLVTTGLMVLVSAVYCAVVGYRNGYTSTKTWIMFWWCMVKMVDSVTDVLEGRLQQTGRIDISARSYVLRTVTAITCMLIVLVLTKDLMPATITALIVEGVVALVVNITLKDDYGSPFRQIDQRVWKSVWLMMVMCFPVFVYGFCNLYMTNVPKMAVDTVLGDEAQAVYGIIAMPVFVVNLLAQFVYEPILRTLGICFHNREYEIILTRIRRLVLVILGITGVCIGGAALLGVPVFNWMYRTDIAAYKGSLLILLAGGGAQALCTLFVSALTVVRHQKGITWVYAVFSLTATAIFVPVVRKFGIMGNCICYSVITLAIAIVLGMMFELHVKVLTNKTADIPIHKA